jgi:hypothetical protein
MRRVITVLVLSAALSGCKKKEEQASAGSGSAAAAADKALEAVGSAAAAAGQAGAAAENAAKMAGSAAIVARTAAGTVLANVPRPASVTDAQVAIANKLVVTLNDMGKGITAAGTDCKKATAAVEAGTKALEPIKAEAMSLKQLGESDQSVKIWFESTYAPQFMEALGPLIGAAATCGSDAKFMDAMKKVEVGK